MIQLRLLPTHSRYADSGHNISTPRGWRLLEHQVDTFQAIAEKTADIILHTGMTGDGKSLAGQLMALNKPNYRILGMYPTNELVSDQKRGFDVNAQRWSELPGKRKLLQSIELNAHILDQHSLEEDVKRATSLSAFIGNTDLLLTNPDIVHYIFSGRYLSTQQQPFHLIENLVNNYDQLTYDEFHLFDQQQVSAILAQIIFIHHYAGHLKPTILLQSATPDENIRQAIERAGLTMHTIEGSYLHQEGEAPAGYRTILQGVNLTIVAGKPDEWMREHAQSDLHPALQSGHTRVAGLFNSVWKTVALHDALAALLPPKFQVLPNTGITPPSIRKASHEADVVLGTATVDVGVDLKINFLVFEAYDAASFKQRLGRLGRHGSFIDRSHQTRDFAGFRAVACVPEWIYAQLEEKLQPEMNREDFFKVIDEVLPGRRHVNAYNRLWGWFPAYHLYYRLGRPVIKNQHGDIQQPTAQALENALGVKFTSHEAHYRDITKKKTHQPIRDALDAFRGGSPFTAILVNEHYQGSERYQFYDLLNLLQRADFEPLDLEQVKRDALQAGLTERHFNRNQPLVALHQRGVLERPRRLYLTMSNEAWLAQVNNLTGKVAAVSGLEIITEPHAPLDDTHLRIRQYEVAVCVALHTSAEEVRRTCRLGLFFPLYNFQTFDNQNGCIALGRDALLLDAALAFRRNPDNFIIT